MTPENGATMKRYAVALATTAALVGAGFAVPQAGAQNETAAHAVAGLSWPDLDIKAGETKTLNPNTCCVLPRLTRA